MRKRLHIATIGFGWMGQAHSRSYRRIPSLFPERTFDPVLAICADNVESRRTTAVEDFGYERAVEHWEDAVTDPSIDIVNVSAPNMLHEEVCLKALAAGKHVFCEKPVGGTPPQTARVAAAARGTSAVTARRWSFTPIRRSIRLISPRSPLVANVVAVPRTPARPVRPTRWTKSSATCGRS